MLGYVTCEKAELKVKDFELYGGYYCGVCKSIGERYGQLPRMALSYDAAFLALVLSGLSREEDKITREHCLVHPIKKKTIVSNEEIDYAGDVMLLLAWFKLLDDARDEGKIHAKALMKLVGRNYQRIAKKRAKLNKEVEDQLGILSQLEEEKCPSLDQVSEPFAKIMEEIFTGDKDHEDMEKRLLRRVGYHLGKWIYLMDAWDDLEENVKTGAYNPLIYRYEYKEEEGIHEFQERIHDYCEQNLLIYLGELSKTYDLLSFYKNQEIIDNIIYMGLLRRTETILRKEEDNDEKSL